MKKINFLFLIIVFLIPVHSFSWFENDFEPVWQDSGSGFVSSEEKFTNFLGMEFVYIKPGTFMMGSPSSESGRYSDEKQHKVTLTKGHFMQTTEVTQGQWKKVMGNNPSDFKNCGDNCPVESVSWNDAKEFIKKLNNKDKNFTYRLPTEAEWEYAARGGTKTALYTGDITIKGQRNAPELDKIAWYGGNSCVDYAGGYDCSDWKEKQYSCSRCGTRKTGLKTPNAFGLYDMIGNVWEWCEDWYGDYPSGHVTDPRGPGSGSYRVIRGGSWGDYAVSCRSAGRGYSSPGFTFSNGGGFRLAAFRGRH
jgi:formylglycine-generating enzyme required for sulfatase activity